MKIYLLSNEYVFVTIPNSYIGDKIMDVSEGLIVSPRMMVLFSFAFL